MNPENVRGLRTCSLTLLLIGVVIAGQFGCRDTGGESTVYKRHCASCHGSKGQGLRSLYPSLKESEYLDKNLERLPCLIISGVRGTVRMPGFAHLSTPEITELVSFLNNNWGTIPKTVSEQMVASWLKDCP